MVYLDFQKVKICGKKGIAMSSSITRTTIVDVLLFSHKKRYSSQTNRKHVHQESLNRKVMIYLAEQLFAVGRNFAILDVDGLSLIDADLNQAVGLLPESRHLDEGENDSYVLNRRRWEAITSVKPRLHATTHDVKSVTVPTQKTMRLAIRE